MKEPLTNSLILVTKKYLNAFSSEMAHLPLDRYQYILVLIDEHGECLSQKALSEILQIDKSYMVIILDYLTEKGCVVREQNPKDRREQLIKLTDSARDILPQIRKIISELNKKALSNITSTEIELFNEVLKKIGNNLAENLPNNIMVDFKYRLKA
ncbi:MAG: MarR family transcriptional regulator [Daejeonella sp.]